MTQDFAYKIRGRRDRSVYSECAGLAAVKMAWETIGDFGDVDRILEIQNSLNVTEI